MIVSGFKMIIFQQRLVTQYQLIRYHMRLFFFLFEFYYGSKSDSDSNHFLNMDESDDCLADISPI